MWYGAGDAHLGSHTYDGRRRGRDVQYHFRLALADPEGLLRTARYLLDSNTLTREFQFQGATETRRAMRGIRNARACVRGTHRRDHRVAAGPGHG